MRRSALFLLVSLAPLLFLNLVPAAAPDPVAIPSLHQPMARDVVRYDSAYRYPQAGWIVLHVEGEPSDTLLRLRGVVLDAAYLVRDGVRIELLRFASPAPPAPRVRSMHEHGLTHLSFRVADLDATLTALRAAGEPILEETVIRIPEFGAAACMIVDPDGQLIELVQSPADPEAPPGTH